MNSMRATKAIIHLDYFKENILNIKQFTQAGTKLCIPVKADAYGHGAVECAKAALEVGADFLAIATVEEGAQLRAAGIQAPVLLFSLCAPEEMDALVQNNITPFVFDKDYISLIAQAVKNAGKTAYPVHLAVDTGMGRIGCLPEEAACIAQCIVQTGALSLGGMCTHFATSDSLAKTDRLFTQIQFSRFTEAIDAVKKAGIAPGICHCANSAATLDLPETHLDMVRPGIIVYGYDADQVNAAYLSQKGTPITLRPVMTLETEICAIRRFTRGMSVGYGRTWSAVTETDIAVLPIGYGDGLLRRFSEAGLTVSINGKAYPVRGRICMDQCMVDIGKDNKNVQRWDKAIIFGSAEDGALQTADDIARLTGTISYEITSLIRPRVERVFVG